MHNDGEVALQLCQQFSDWVYIGYHQLLVSFQYLSSDDVSNTTRVTKLQMELRRNRRRDHVLIVALAVFEQKRPDRNSGSGQFG